MQQKRIEDLSLIDDFLFTEASTDIRTAEVLMRLIIERSTGLKVKNLMIEPQKVVNGIDTDRHGIRMDVSVSEMEKEEGKIIRLFDIEPNNISSVNLPKRSRYYQALTDVKLLEIGTDYDKLPELWSIWILPYDPFGENQMLYFVKNVVEGLENIDYNDGVRKLFLYIDGEYGGNEALKHLLKYIKSSNQENAVDSELENLHTNVERLKYSKEVGVKYMQLQEILKYVEKDARAEGIEQGIEQGIERVVMVLIEAYGELGATREEIIYKIAEKLQITNEQAEIYVKKSGIQ